MKQLFILVSAFVLCGILLANKSIAQEQTEFVAHQGELGISPFSYSVHGYGLGFHYAKKVKKSSKDKWVQFGFRYNTSAYNRAYPFVTNEGKDFDSHREYYVAFKYYVIRTNKIEWAIGHSQHYVSGIFNRSRGIYPENYEKVMRTLKRTGEYQLGKYSKKKLGVQFDTYFNYILTDKMALGFQGGVGTYVLDMDVMPDFLSWNVWVKPFTLAGSAAVVLTFRF